MAMFHSDSEDGYIFRVPGEVCFERPEQGYRQDGTFRDPSVLWDEKAGIYRMFFCAKAPEESADPNVFAGVVGRAVSPDLIHWACEEPMTLTGIAVAAECPQILPIGNRFVLSYYWHESRFRTSDTVTGPWERSAVISPDHFDYMAARMMQDGDRLITVGWLPRKTCDCAERTWGGNMCIPRELTFPDGKTPHSRIIPEVLALFRSPAQGCAPADFVLPSAWQATENGFIVSSPEGGSMALLAQLPEVFRLCLDVTLSSDTGTFTLFLGGNFAPDGLGALTDLGFMLTVDAPEGLIRLRRNKYDQRPDAALIPYAVKAGQTVSLDLVMDGDILELGVNQKATLVSRLNDRPHGHFAMLVSDTDATIENFAITVAE